jgi:predicted DNA-binding transcriptional regulator YafY
MSTNKHAAFRYRILDACFRSHRKWTIPALMEETAIQLRDAFETDVESISKRTIQNDIALMRSEPPRGFAAPIVCKSGFYFYEDKKFSIATQPFTESDILAVKEAATLLRQFPDLPHFQDIEMILSRVEREVSLVNQPTALVQFETNRNLKGLKSLGEIWKAMLQKKSILIKYQPFYTEKSNDFAFSPYLLKEYRNRWFCFGKKISAADLVILALDRIVSLKESIVIYEENKIFNPETYFNDFIGVSFPTKFSVQHIRFRVSPFQTQYLLTKPIHTSQKLIHNTSTYAEFSLDLIPNYELAAELWRLGPDLLSIEPKGILEEVLLAYREQ